MLNLNKELKGSNLASAMLERGDERVWCAVSNDSDEYAMTKINNADYSCLKHIISFNNNHFFCEDETSWQYAVPVKKVEITPQDAGF